MSLTRDDFQLERFDNVTCWGPFVNSENPCVIIIYSFQNQESKQAYLAHVTLFSSEVLSRNM
jgi:hypothetical protein